MLFHLIALFVKKEDDDSSLIRAAMFEKLQGPFKTNKVNHNQQNIRYEDWSELKPLEFS